MNGLNNFHKTDKKYSLASIDELITFRRSEVKVTAGRRGPIMWTQYLMNYLSDLNETY